MINVMDAKFDETCRFLAEYNNSRSAFSAPNGSKLKGDDHAYSGPYPCASAGGASMPCAAAAAKRAAIAEHVRGSGSKPAAKFVPGQISARTCSAKAAAAWQAAHRRRRKSLP